MENRILELSINNIKVIEVAHIVPGDGAVIITGENGSGKSTTLDCIKLALEGGGSGDMLRHGQERGEITVRTPRYVIKKVVTKGGDRLEVTTEEGAKFSSPQALLDELVGAISFDPMEFANFSKKDQAEVLLKSAGIDFEEDRNARKEIFDKRTDKNREIKRLEANLGAPPLEGVSTEEMSMSAQLEIVRGLEAKKTAYEEAFSQQVDRDSNVSHLRREVKEAEEKIATIQEIIEEKKRMIEGLNNNPVVFPEQVTEEDVEVERNKLNFIEAHNEKARSAKKYFEIKSEWETANSDVESFTQQLKGFEEAKSEKVRSIKLPLEGLKVTDEAVTFNGVEIGGLSTGEKVRVSTAIAMGLNPNLKVIFVRDGSNLDKEGFDQIIALAKDRGYQIWIEKVKGAVLVDGKTVYPNSTIHFVEGEIVAVDGKGI